MRGLETEVAEQAKLVRVEAWRPTDVNAAAHERRVAGDNVGKLVPAGEAEARANVSRSVALHEGCEFGLRTAFRSRADRDARGAIVEPFVACEQQRRHRAAEAERVAPVA